jgi:hypothetical protein
MFTQQKRRQLTIVALLALTSATACLESSKAQAQTASISGSSTLTTGGTIQETFVGGVLTDRTITNGVITTVSGETVLPSGYFFSGPVTVKPDYSTISNGTIAVVGSLSIDATAAVTDSTTSFSRAAAEILTKAAFSPDSITDLESVVSIIKAGAGVNGLD